MRAYRSGPRLTVGLLLVVSMIPAAPTCAAPPDISELRSRQPEALVPGCVTPLLDNDPPGYLICTLVTKYFDDETIADLQDELQLAARLLFVRFMTVGRSESTSRVEMTIRGFQHIAMWWDDGTLRGLFFVPADGLLWDGQPSGGAPSPTNASPEQLKGPTAAALLLDARSLRKRHEFQAAREVLGQLRKNYAMSPEARRALRELYFVNTAESRIRSRGAGGQ
jgi:hypothetical protein